jgi:hypothetical protein
VQLTLRTAKPVDLATAALMAQNIDSILGRYGVGPKVYVTFPELLTLAANLESPPPLAVGSYVSDALAAQSGEPQHRI